VLVVSTTGGGVELMIPVSAGLVLEVSGVSEKTVNELATSATEVPKLLLALDGTPAPFMSPSQNTVN